MLVVTAKAKEKLQEVLKRQTAEPDVALRVTPTHPAHNRLELVLDREKRGDQVVQAKNGTAVLLIRPDLAQRLSGITIDYRLTDKASFPAQIHDCKGAIRWVRAHGKRYHLDSERMAACGGSAGGNYAAMICLTASVTEFDDPRLGNTEYPCHVRAAVDMFGPTDFLKMDAQLDENGFGPGGHGAANSPESKYLGAKLSDVPLKVVLANPMTYIHEHMPPLLIQHGRLDTMVPVQQSMIFVEKLEKYVHPDRFEFDILEGAGHGDPLFETDENMARVFFFLDRYLK